MGKLRPVSLKTPAVVRFKDIRNEQSDVVKNIKTTKSVILLAIDKAYAVSKARTKRFEGPFR